jgi:hypothetical protein
MLSNADTSLQQTDFLGESGTRAKRMLAASAALVPVGSRMSIASSTVSI